MVAILLKHTVEMCTVIGGWEKCKSEWFLNAGEFAGGCGNEWGRRRRGLGANRRWSQKMGFWNLRLLILVRQLVGRNRLTW